MTDSRPSYFSLTTDVPGAGVEVTVMVQSLFDDAPVAATG